jgi:peroxiredoxin
MPRKLALYASAMAVLALTSTGAPKNKPVDLTLTNSNGERVRLRDYRGQIVVLNFWATWCGPCNEEMPMLVRAEKDYKARGVTFIGASLDDSKTRKNVPEFARKHEVGFPVWIGATGDDLAKLGMGEAVPATAFIDRDGVIVARVSGQIPESELKERIDWLIGERSGPPPQPFVSHLEPR